MDRASKKLNSGYTSLQKSRLKTAEAVPPARRFITGYTLPELLIYIAVMIVVVAVIVAGLIQFRNVRDEARSGKLLGTTALQVFDQLLFEIRMANRIVVADSTFATSNGRLTLEREIGGDDVATTFSIEDGRLKSERDGVNLGHITHENVRVSDFFVYRIPTAQGEAVTMRLVLEPVDDASKSQVFYSTAVLRGAYD